MNEADERHSIATAVSNPNPLNMNHLPNLLPEDNSPPQSPLNEAGTTSKSQQPIASKEPCTIYKISLDFLNQSNMKTNDKFMFNQLCENSSRTIQRDVSNIASQFLFNDDELSKQYSVYQKIINSNVIIFSILIIRVQSHI
jgi:hypothetical protein